MRWIRSLLPMLWLVAATVLVAGLLVGFRPLTQGGELEQPWATIIFAIAVPLIVQAVMFVADRYGKEPSHYVAQGLSLLLAIGYIAVTGGFAGLQIPTFPIWPDEIMGFVGGLLLWLGLWIELLLAAAGAVEIVYRIVLKAVMEKTGFAPARKLAERAAVQKAKAEVKALRLKRKK